MSKPITSTKRRNPGFQGFFRCLLGMKTEYFVGKNILIHHAAKRSQVTPGNVQHLSGVVKVAHTILFLPAKHDL